MLAEKKKEFLKKGTDKNQFMDDMFQFHRRLFEYPSMIEGSPIKKIEISQQDVTFTIRNNEKDFLISCDPKDAHALPMSFLNFSKYESEENDMMLRLIKPGSVVFDIGANIGWYTLNIMAGCQSTVYSFEPIKASYKLLLKNIEQNHFKKDWAFNFGFSNRSGVVRFYHDIECSAASSMANLRERNNTVLEKCRIKKMDDFVGENKSIKRIDFIKCDVEGAEKLVFEGGLETIKKHKPIIFTEMLRKWSRKFSYHPNDIIKLLSGIGYECYVIHKKRIKKISEVTEKTIETNYLFFDRVKHRKIVDSLKK